mmetsp:Transcript_2692/g.4137  ORF Transcript_2692/g.4137 Transcript_2692/m.4137 type:complete len:90 (-) Transcript_2692:34-303(-)
MQETEQTVLYAGGYMLLAAEGTAEDAADCVHPTVEQVPLLIKQKQLDTRLFLAAGQSLQTSLSLSPYFFMCTHDIHFDVVCKRRDIVKT